MSVFEGPKTGVDVETSGVDPWEDRIVSIAVVLQDPSADGGADSLRTMTWLINPGVELSAEVTAIHGITNEMVAAGGKDPAVVLAQVMGIIDARTAEGIPVVAYNAAFDLTMIRAEAARYGLEPWPEDFGPVIDPLIIDKRIDTYRKGSRRLVDVCALYGVTLGDAHNAAADAAAAVMLATAFQTVNAADQFQDPWDFHRLQQQWQEEQRVSYNRYRIGRGEHDKLQGPGWPFYQKES